LGLIFRQKYLDELQRIKNLAEKQDVNLVCFCAPKSCHGDIIKEIIELFIKEKKDFI
jgi:tryptophan synthase alpha subunit